MVGRGLVGRGCEKVWLMEGVVVVERGCERV